MATEVLKLELSNDEKRQLKFIKECREERMDQFRDDYLREEAARLADLEGCDE